MSNYRRVNTEGSSYFFTAVAYRRQSIFCDDMFRNALREGIQVTKLAKPFVIDSWVLLPDHMHCIWTLPENDADFGVRWAMIKRHVTKACPELYRNEIMTESKKLRNESTIWQRRFWEHRIRDEEDYNKHMDYIHYNPVKHKLAVHVKDWPYSTFHRYVKDGIYENDWGSNIIVKPGSSFGE